VAQLVTIGAEARILAAAHEAAARLELSRHVAAGATSVPLLAAAAGVAARRLAPLVDVLCSAGALRREDGGRLAPGQPPARAGAAAGAGLIVRALLEDRGLDRERDGLAARVDAAALEVGPLLGDRGPAARAQLAARLAPAVGDGVFLDAGGGLGEATRALLAAAPAASAVLADRPEIVRAARAALADLGARVAFVAGELDEAPLPAGCRAALLDDVLHMNPAPRARRIVERAAAALAPGGVLLVKDARLEDGHGPTRALLLALCAVVLSDDGAVHDARALRGWLEGAGLEDVRVEPVADALLLIGRRPGPT
jgi:SAM-dependent methyltransferase